MNFLKIDSEDSSIPASNSKNSFITKLPIFCYTKVKKTEILANIPKHSQNFHKLFQKIFINS